MKFDILWTVHRDIFA